jgi:secreted trypsin-like serine protease
MGRLAWLLLAWSSVSRAGTIEDTISDARYRQYGETFAPYTCRLVGTNTDDEIQVGTCTLVGPCWALTAAHVVENLTSGGVMSQAGHHRIDRIYVHREYGGEFAKHDIALVHVATPFRLTRYPPLTDGSEKAGDVCTAAGYGVTGPLSSGYHSGDMMIRAGTMRLTSAERSVWVCQITRGNSPLPFCIAPGDSGGPLWARASDGSTVLVGVNSYTASTGTSTKSRSGEESGHTRVSLYLDWIAEIAGKLDEPCTLAACQP